jgi:hypothetical protein
MQEVLSQMAKKAEEMMRNLETASKFDHEKATETELIEYQKFLAAQIEDMENTQREIEKLKAVLGPRTDRKK